MEAVIRNGQPRWPILALRAREATFGFMDFLQPPAFRINTNPTTPSDPELVARESLTITTG